MDWGNFVIALFMGTFAGSVVAILANRRKTSADTYQKLSATVSSLIDDLGEERAHRRKDKAYFQEELERIRVDYKYKLAALEARVCELEVERTELILENHKLRKRFGE